MSDAITYYFNDIFSSYEEWQEFSSSLDFIDFENPEDANFDKFCYKILSRMFWNCNIRYTDINAFLGALANVYEFKFDEFKREKELVDAIQNISLDELKEINQSISNVANNPNDNVDDPTLPLNYISAQSYNLAKNGKLRSYLDALNNLPSLDVDNFLRGNERTKDKLHFVDLFMNVQINKLINYGD